MLSSFDLKEGRALGTCSNRTHDKYDILINRGGVTARHGDPHRLEELSKETAIERLEAHVRGHE